MLTDDTLQTIRDDLQTWTTAALLKMERYTHHEGQWVIRLELANRGVDTDGLWVGFPKAWELWTVCRSSSEEEQRFYAESN